MREPEKREERRKLERFKLNVPARIELLKSNHEKEILNLLTSDICSGGAFFQTSEPLREGTPVRIDLVLSLDRLRRLKDMGLMARIKVTGKVLRSEPSGMAVCFDTNYVLRPCEPTQS